MAELSLPKRSPDIGECIYCGSQEPPLSTEHAVPYALNGPWTLLHASCAKCAKTTHHFERDCTRGLFGSSRIALAMQTRRPTQRPDTLPLFVQAGGEKRVLEVSHEEFPFYLPMITLPPPGAATGLPPRAIEPKDVNLSFTHLSGPSFEEVRAKYGAEFAGTRLNFEPQGFGRMVAKIAFCAAVYTMGLEALRLSPIRAAILGEDPNVGYWVGSWILDPQTQPKGIHAMKVRKSGTAFHVILRLFAQFGAPEYHVVLGHGSDFGSLGETSVMPNNGLHQTGRGGVAFVFRRRPVVEARPAGEPECWAGI